MSDHRISLAAYKEAVPLEGVPLSVTVDGFVLAAFVEAVEASYSNERVGDHDCWTSEGCAAGRRLDAALARFDFEAEA